MDVVRYCVESLTPGERETMGADLTDLHSWTLESCEQESPSPVAMVTSMVLLQIGELIMQVFHRPSKVRLRR